MATASIKGVRDLRASRQGSLERVPLERRGSSTSSVTQQATASVLGFGAGAATHVASAGATTSAASRADKLAVLSQSDKELIEQLQVRGRRWTHARRRSRRNTGPRSAAQLRLRPPRDLASVCGATSPPPCADQAG